MLDYKDGPMFEKILLATDGSEHADRAAKAALELAKKLPDAHVTIVHISPSAPTRDRLLEAKFDVLSVLVEKAHHAVIQTELKFRREKLAYRLEVAIGDPADEIVALSEKGNYDLIILGSRGLSSFQELVLGSVSHKVAHHAKCPVMIVK